MLYAIALMIVIGVGNWSSATPPNPPDLGTGVRVSYEDALRYLQADFAIDNPGHTIPDESDLMEFCEESDLSQFDQNIKRACRALIKGDKK